MCRYGRNVRLGGGLSPITCAVGQEGQCTTGEESQIKWCCKEGMDVPEEAW